MAITPEAGPLSHAASMQLRCDQCSDVYRSPPPRDAVHASAASRARSREGEDPEFIDAMHRRFAHKYGLTPSPSPSYPPHAPRSPPAQPAGAGAAALPAALRPGDIASLVAVARLSLAQPPQQAAQPPPLSHEHGQRRDAATPPGPAPGCALFGRPPPGSSGPPPAPPPGGGAVPRATSATCPLLAAPRVVVHVAPPPPPSAATVVHVAPPPPPSAAASAVFHARAQAGQGARAEAAELRGGAQVWSREHRARRGGDAGLYGCLHEIDAGLDAGDELMVQRALQPAAAGGAAAPPAGGYRVGPEEQRELDREGEISAMWGDVIAPPRSPPRYAAPAR